jgi:hypothetical protein
MLAKNQRIDQYGGRYGPVSESVSPELFQTENRHSDLILQYHCTPSWQDVNSTLVQILSLWPEPVGSQHLSKRSSRQNLDAVLGFHLTMAAIDQDSAPHAG